MAAVSGIASLAAADPRIRRDTHATIPITTWRR
jgi:hypothetical protein